MSPRKLFVKVKSYYLCADLLRPEKGASIEFLKDVIIDYFAIVEVETTGEDYMTLYLSNGRSRIVRTEDWNVMRKHARVNTQSQMNGVVHELYPLEMDNE